MRAPPSSRHRPAAEPITSPSRPMQAEQDIEPAAPSATAARHQDGVVIEGRAPTCAGDLAHGRARKLLACQSVEKRCTA